MALSTFLIVSAFELTCNSSLSMLNSDKYKEREIGYRTLNSILQSDTGYPFAKKTLEKGMLSDSAEVRHKSKKLYEEIIRKEIAWLEDVPEFRYRFTYDEVVKSEGSLSEVIDLYYDKACIALGKNRQHTTDDNTYNGLGEEVGRMASKIYFRDFLLSGGSKKGLDKLISIMRENEKKETMP